MTQNKISIRVKRTLSVLLLTTIMFLGCTSVFSNSAAAEEEYAADSVEVAQNNTEEENRKWSILGLVGMLLLYAAAASVWFAVCQLFGYYFIDIQTGLCGNIDLHQKRIDQTLERMRRNAYMDGDI